jgi:hypothetical protein
VTIVGSTAATRVNKIRALRVIKGSSRGHLNTTEVHITVVVVRRRLRRTRTGVKVTIITTAHVTRSTVSLVQGQVLALGARMGSTVRVVTTVAVARGTGLKHTAPTIKTSVSVTTVRVLKGMITVTKTVRRRVTTVAVNRRTRVNE